MTSNDNKNTDKSIIEHPRNPNDPSLEVIIKAINYPPGYPENKQCNKKEEKHKNCHPMHCHHMQPMQSTTNTLVLNNTIPDHAEQNSQDNSKK